MYRLLIIVKRLKLKKLGLIISLEKSKVNYVLFLVSFSFIKDFVQTAYLIVLGHDTVTYSLLLVKRSGTTHVVKVWAHSFTIAGFVLQLPLSR